MIKIQERANKRGMIEKETIETLARELKKKGYSIQSAFNHIDQDNSG